jgi:hypothetical protein
MLALKTAAFNVFILMTTQLNDLSGGKDNEKFKNSGIQNKILTAGATNCRPARF